MWHGGLCDEERRAGRVGGARGHKAKNKARLLYIVVECRLSVAIECGNVIAGYLRQNTFRRLAGS